MDKPRRYEVSRAFAARLTFFMFHQHSAEWAQTVDTKVGTGWAFWQLDSLLDAADE